MLMGVSNLNNISKIISYFSVLFSLIKYTDFKITTNLIPTRNLY